MFSILSWNKIRPSIYRKPRNILKSRIKFDKSLTIFMRFCSFSHASKIIKSHHLSVFVFVVVIVVFESLFMLKTIHGFSLNHCADDLVLGVLFKPNGLILVPEIFVPRIDIWNTTKDRDLCALFLTHCGFMTSTCDIAKGQGCLW